MRTTADVESYLHTLGRRFEEAPEAPGTFLISSGIQGTPIALRVEPPLVVVRLHIGKVETKNPTALFQKLLELNAEALFHTSYGLSGGDIVLTSALELENLDLNELGVVLDECDLVLSEQVKDLFSMTKGA